MVVVRGGGGESGGYGVVMGGLRIWGKELGYMEIGCWYDCC